MNELTSQKELIESKEWNNLIIMDAMRYDYFEEFYPEYLEGELLKVYNNGVSYTLDWWSEMFTEKHDAVLYDPTPFTLEQQEGVDWKYSEHFNEVVGPERIDFDHEKGTSTPKMINETVRRHDGGGRKVIRYMPPHPPLPGLPVTKGSGKIKRTEEKLIKGEITEEDLEKAYEKNVRIVFEGVVDLIPDLDGEVVVTADHGEALGGKRFSFPR